MSQSACVIASIESSESAVGVMSGNRWRWGLLAEWRVCAHLGLNSSFMTFPKVKIESRQEMDFMLDFSVHPHDRLMTYDFVSKDQFFIGPTVDPGDVQSSNAWGRRLQRSSCQHSSWSCWANLKFCDLSSTQEIKVVVKLWFWMFVNWGHHWCPGRHREVETGRAFSFPSGSEAAVTLFAHVAERLLRRRGSDPELKFLHLLLDIGMPACIRWGLAGLKDQETRYRKSAVDKHEDWMTGFLLSMSLLRLHGVHQ